MESRLGLTNVVTIQDLKPVYFFELLYYFFFCIIFKDRIVLVLCILKILLLILRVQYVMKWSLIPIGITPD